MIVALSDTSSLLKPLTEGAVLVPNEQVYYAERQHWASIVQPVYDTFIYLLVLVWVVEARTSGFSGINSSLGIFLLAAAAPTVIATITGSRAPTSRLAVDPFSSSNTSIAMSAPVRIGLGLLVLLMLYRFGFGRTGVLTVFVVIARLTTVLARWSFYERRYVTNRRLIESSGFLGSRISSMPLSRVTDIVYGRTVMGEIFNYARMRVETAGQDQALGVVRYISEPDHFYEVLVNFSAPSAPGAKPTPEE